MTRPEETRTTVSSIAIGFPERGRRSLRVVLVQGAGTFGVTYEPPTPTIRIAG